MQLGCSVTPVKLRLALPVNWHPRCRLRYWEHILTFQSHYEEVGLTTKFLGLAIGDTRVQVRSGCASARSFAEARAIVVEAAISSGVDATIVSEPSAGRVEVWANDDAMAAIRRQIAGSAYDGLVEHVPVVIEAAARRGDAPSHYGGAHFKQGSSANCLNTCTSGFKVRRSSDGKLGMSTAGHCRVNTGWSGNLYSKTSFFGEFLNWRFQDGSNDDWGFIGNSTYSRTIYTDPASPSTRSINSSSNWTFNNEVVCYSGSKTLNVCGNVVVDQSAQNCSNGYCTTNVKTTQINGLTACIASDSGGPTYRVPSSGSTEARGMISYHSNSDDCWFQEIGRMVNDGFSVVTT
jgi:hypothetical protein